MFPDDVLLNPRYDQRPARVGPSSGSFLRLRGIGGFDLRADFVQEGTGAF
jgi:hypothetical protein